MSETHDPTPSPDTVFPAKNSALPRILYSLAAMACIAISATGAAFAFSYYFVGQMQGTPHVVAGPIACALSLLLVALPGAIAGNSVRRALLLAVGGTLAAAALFFALRVDGGPSQFPLPLPLPVLCVGYALSVLAVSGRIRIFPALPLRYSHFRSMTALSIVLAAAFAMTGAVIFFESLRSERLMLAGNVMFCLSLFASAVASFGPLHPRMYPMLVYASFFFLWLMIPVAGLEAYIHHDTPIVPHFAKNGWKYVYGLCFVSTVIAARLLQQGYKYLRTIPQEDAPQ